MGKLDGLAPATKSWPCKVRDTAAALDPDDRKVLIDAVANKDWKILQLEIALRERGIDISQTSIRAHRLGTCSCSRI